MYNLNRLDVKYTYEDLLKKDGEKCTGTIGDISFEGEISIQLWDKKKNVVYILQDSIAGTSPHNLKGYKSAWLIDSQEYLETSFEPIVIEFMEKFPEKWCVLSTDENIQELGEWFNKNKQTSSSSYENNGANWFFHYPVFGDDFKYHLDYKIKEGYTEITFEQFKDHFMKNNLYELVKLYPRSPKLGTIVNVLPSGNYMTNSGGIYDEVEIENYPEYWQPVKIKVPKIEEYELSYVKGSTTAGFGCVHFNINSLRGLGTLFTNKFSNQVTSVTINNSIVVTGKQIEEILSYIDSVK